MIKAHADLLEGAVGRQQGAEACLRDGVGDVEEGEGAGGDGGGKGGVVAGCVGIAVGKKVWVVGVRVGGRGGYGSRLVGRSRRSGCGGAGGGIDGLAFGWVSS